MSGAPLRSPESPQISTLELHKEAMKFSAGHFTILSASERERLHGHNFTVYAAITGIVDEGGLLADYAIFKDLVLEICRSYNEYFLLPGRSPYLTIREEGEHLYALFNGETIPFLARDVLVLPIANVSVEELARLITGRIVAEIRPEHAGTILEIVTKVSSGPGQSGSFTWRRT